MKRKDLQNAQEGAGSAENKIENRSHQNSQTTNVLNNQQNTNIHKAGLGRDRMMNIEDMDATDDDLKNEDLNASNDQ